MWEALILLHIEVFTEILFQGVLFFQSLRVFSKKTQNFLVFQLHSSKNEKKCKKIFRNFEGKQKEFKFWWKRGEEERKFFEKFGGFSVKKASNDYL